MYIIKCKLDVQFIDKLKCRINKGASVRTHWIGIVLLLVLGSGFMFPARAVAQSPTPLEPDDSPVVLSGTWQVENHSAASNGTLAVSSGHVDDTLTLTFVGTSIAIEYATDPAYGTLVIEVNGSVLRTIITSDIPSFRRASIDYLEDGVHYLRLYGTTGSIIAIDGVIAIPASPEGTPLPPSGNDNVPTAYTIITAPDEVAGFGTSVAVHDDLLVVGAPYAANGFGRVFVYHHDGSIWQQTTILTPPDNVTGFGTAITLSNSAITVADAAAHAYPFGWDGSGWRYAPAMYFTPAIDSSTRATANDTTLTLYASDGSVQRVLSTQYPISSVAVDGAWVVAGHADANRITVFNLATTVLPNAPTITTTNGDLLGRTTNSASCEHHRAAIDLQASFPTSATYRITAIGRDTSGIRHSQQFEFNELATTNHPVGLYFATAATGTPAPGYPLAADNTAPLADQSQWVLELQQVDTGACTSVVIDYQCDGGDATVTHASNQCLLTG